MTPDKCNSLDIIGDLGWQIATCIDEKNIEWNIYSNQTCSNESKLFTIPINGSYQTGLGTYLDFNCDNDGVAAYTTVEFSTISCEVDNFLSMSAALDVCTRLTSQGGSDADEWFSINIFCDPDLVNLYYYNTPSVDEAECNNNDLFDIANATTECGYLLTSTLTGTQYNIYGAVKLDSLF